MFQAIVHGMGRLLAYFYEVLPNYGVAIILLTVAVRVAMIPLAVKQARVMEANRGNQEKMRKLAPEIKKLKEKYKDDRARLYEEQKKLYDLHGVNMLGSLSGCLPMLLQMPIFMAMYQVLSGCNKLLGANRFCRPEFYIPKSSGLHAAIVEGQARFLTMDLNFRPSQVYSDAGLADALPYYVLVVLMGVTMWYQTKMMTQAQPALDPQMAQTQKFMKIMPLMFVVFSVNFPAGLTVYWTASNAWTIGQQYVLLKRIGLPAEPEKPKAAPVQSGGLLGRLLGNARDAKGSAGGAGRAGSAPKGGKGDRRGGRESGARPARPSRAADRRSASRQLRSREAASGRPRADRARASRVDKTRRTAEAAAGEGAGQPAERDVPAQGAVGGREEGASVPRGDGKDVSGQVTVSRSGAKGQTQKKASGGDGARTQSKARPRGGGSKGKGGARRRNRGGRR